MSSHELLGEVYGVRVEFTDGRCSGLLIDPCRKRFLLQETVPEVSVTGGAIPVSPAESGSGLLCPQAIRINQQLGAVGFRCIELTHEFAANDGNLNSSTDGAAPSAEIRARLTLIWDLTEPLEWHIGSPQATVEPLTQARPRLCFDAGTYIAIEPNDTTTLLPRGPSDRVLRFRLPVGHTRVRFSIHCKPTFSFGSTVLVCRPDQWREAAIVLSCLPRRDFPFLLVLGPPPTTYEQYVALYANYRKTQQALTAEFGGDPHLPIEKDVTLEHGRHFSRLMDAHGHAQSLLAPYRSWWQRLIGLREMLCVVRPLSVIYLFEPARELLHPWMPVPMPATASTRFEDRQFESISLLPDIRTQLRILPGMEKCSTQRAAGNDETYHRYATLTELSELCRKLWRSDQPVAPVSVPVGGVGMYIAALTEALRLNQPLRPGSELATDIATACERANQSIDGDEAVLVEETDDANNLLAALYAWHRGARLVVTQPPPPEEIENALLAVQRDVESQARQNTAEPRAKAGLFAKVLEAARQRFDSDAGMPSLGQLQTVVTRGVPKWATDVIGPRVLTAFTYGVPYAFVKTSAGDWRHKPIGHVAGDAALLIYGEMYAREVPRSPITFNLVFDPGEFDDPETPQVIRSLEDHFTHTLVLSKSTATVDALTVLLAIAPLETVFFITHGTGRSIQVGEHELLGSNIPQWINMRSRPVIFNNSCLSWTGVGREFVRAGARAYIGTLWSVDTRHATTFARRVMPRIAAGIPVATATQRTGVPASVACAYLLVGTGSVALEQWHDPAVKRSEHFLVEGLRTLIKMLEQLSPRQGNIELQRSLYAECVRFKERLRRSTKRYRVYALLLHEQYAALATIAKSIGLTSEAEAQLFNETQEAIDTANFPTVERIERRIDLYSRATLVRTLRGSADEALQTVNEGLDFARQAAVPTTWLHILRSDLYKSAGRWSDALKDVQTAFEISERQHSVRGKLASLGRLTQLHLRREEYDYGLKRAEQGIHYAQQVNETRELSGFTLDRANILMRQQRYEEALRDAHEGRRLAHSHLDWNGELIAHGVIGQCLQRMERLEEAFETFQLGLQKARASQNAREEAVFLLDLSNVCQQRGDLPAALRYLLAATDIQLDIGLYEWFLQNSLPRICQLGLRVEAWDAIGRILALGVRYIPDVLESHRIIEPVADALLDGARTMDPQVLKSGVVDMASYLESALQWRQPAQDEFYPRLLAEIPRLLRDWVLRVPHVQQTALRLDQLTEHHYRFLTRLEWITRVD